MNNPSSELKKNIRKVKVKMANISNQVVNSKLSDPYLCRICLKNRFCKCVLERASQKVCFGLQVFSIIFCFLVMLVIFWDEDFTDEVTTVSQSCIINNPAWFKHAFRPPVDCSSCENIKGIIRLNDVSPTDFENNYAYEMQPIIVTDAMKGWKAIHVFNFEFFKEFYNNITLGKRVVNCFFFSYRSGFQSLDEVFNMEKSRSELNGTPWYVGWNTCYDKEITELRSFYDRPYFLPNTAESDIVDWIFMGGPGQGAHMHLDSVKYMSWQAQIKGNKQWELAPPTECLYTCPCLSFDVRPGEILVVDTNRWFHRTQVLPGDMSITIGAEYD